MAGGVDIAEFAASSSGEATGKLARFAATLTFADIPGEVLKRSSYLALDGFGCAAVGVTARAYQTAMGAFTSLDGDGDVPLWFTGKAGTAMTSTVLNSLSVQAWEMDDYHLLGPLHGSSVVLPAVFTTAQRVNATSGEEVATAIVVGQEVGPRVGMACGGMAPLRRGWHNGAIFASIAGSAAAGRVRNLDPGRMEHCLGLGGTQAGGLMSAQYSAMSTYLHHGLAARAGVLAASLAAANFTGIQDVIARPYGGLISNFSDFESSDIEQLTAGLGSVWEINRIAIKPYANMAGVHLPIQLAQGLVDSNGLSLHDIDRVVVEVPGWLHEKGGDHFGPDSEPVAAQMSIRYGVAIFLLEGAALPHHFTRERIAMDDVHQLIQRIEVIADADLDRKYGPGTFASRVTILFGAGSQRSAFAEHPRGSHEDPLTNEEIVEKFHTLTSPLLPSSRRQEIVRRVTHLHDFSLEDLLDVLAEEVDPS
jgi:2-methylcitrate dehydratase PrpD